MAKMFRDRITNKNYCFSYHDSYFLLTSLFHLAKLHDTCDFYGDHFICNINDKVFEFIKEICDQDIPR